MDEIYREYILEHYKHPHNWGELEPHSHEFEDNNPLCGDELKVQLRVTDDARFDSLKAAVPLLCDGGDIALEIGAAAQHGALG